MKLKELLQVVEKGTDIKIVKGENENLNFSRNPSVPRESEVTNIKNGIDCLVIYVK